MYPTINILSNNKKNITIFHLKIDIFTAIKYCCILYGHVCVMHTRLQGRLIDAFVFRCLDSKITFLYPKNLASLKPSMGAFSGCQHG